MNLFTSIKSKALLYVFLFLLPVASFSQTNTWDGSSSNNWNTAANWSLNLVPTAAHDVVVNINAAINVDVSATINSLTVSGSATVSFTSSGGGRVITIDNTGNSIALGSTLTLQGSNGSGTRSMSIVYTGASQTMSIGGVLVLTNVGEGTIYNATNSLTTVTGTIRNQDLSTGTIGVITSTTANLSFASGGFYHHALDGGSIPTATWNAASTCNITGITGTGMGGLNQSFGNFTWDCIGQTSGFLFAGLLTTINGNFTVSNTNTFGLFLATTAGSTYTLTVGGNLIINDNAWLAITLGDNITATVNVLGNFSMSGAGAGTTFFDYHPATGGTITMNKIIMNVTGNFSQSGGQFDFTSGDSDAANFAELRIGGNYALSGTGVMGTSTSDNSITNGTITFNKSGTQTFNAATPGNLIYTNFIVAANSTLELLSNIQLTSEALAVWGGNFTVNNGGVLDAGTNQIISSTGATGGSFNVFTLSSGAGIITANVNGIQNTTTGTVSTSIATRTYSSAANYTYDGLAIQNSGTFTTSPTANEVNNLTVNNTAGSTTTGVTLQQPFAVAGTLTLTSGHFTTTSNLLTMKAGSGVAGQNYASRISGGTNNSFVNGPMRKVGNTDFLFPVGKVNGGERYCGISAPANPTDAFDAEFIRGNATALGAVTSSGLNHVSFCEYWDIDRTTGSSNVNVTLSWSGSSPCNAAVYVNDLATLVVAHFGTTWDAHGNDGGNTGNVSAGSVTWNNVSTFSPFSLGSTDEATNPLPVKFTAIKAYPVGNRNKIEWTNLTETAIDKYEIERSTDGISFAAINSVNARTNTGGKEEYDAFDDNTAFATIWYRIKARSIDGSSIYSAVVKVSRDDKDDTKLLVYPNPVVGKQLTLQFYSSRNENYTVRIFSNSGQQVYSTNWNHAGGSASRSIELPASLSSGYYHLQVTGSDKTLTSKFVIQ
jgi:Secretion system C-terminal sorting domain